MSLKSYVQHPIVRAKLKPLRPGGPRKVPASCKVRLRGRDAGLIGTAFDYLLRFEIERRARYVECAELMASSAVVGAHSISHWPNSPQVDQVFERVLQAMATADRAHQAYAGGSSPSDADRLEIAKQCLVLGHLEVLRRFHQLHPLFDQPSADDAEELLELLQNIPNGLLDYSETFVLNPSFGQFSGQLGGADADVINGDLLLDLKVVQKGTIEVSFLDQLFGYFLLARRYRLANPQFPEVRRAGLYFARHGYLWTFPTTDWTDHPQFGETEDWFFANTELAHPISKARLLKHRLS